MINNIALFIFISPLLGLGAVVFATLFLVFWIKLFQFFRVDVILSNFFKWVDKVLK